MNARRFFAEEIETLCDLRNAALVGALATVRREQFLPPGPWTIQSEVDFLSAGPRRTRDADPRRIYHNVAVAIDPDRQLYNGAPSLLALCIDRLDVAPGHRVLHVGCGPGYYTALMAECVGSTGKVVAVEIDEALADAAARNLAAWPQVQVQRGDGMACADPFDAILVNAGVTHPQHAWLEAMIRGGRMILPLTATMPAMGPIGKGFLVLLTRREADFEAHALNLVTIYSALGIRDADLNAHLGRVLMRGFRPAVSRLRRDPHDESPACWFHGPGFCFSA